MKVTADAEQPLRRTEPKVGWAEVTEVTGRAFSQSSD
jgi:hypothetical protein